MLSDYDEQIMRSVDARIKKAFSLTKKCYIPGCKNAPIRAHSVSRSRLLTKISEDGMVIMPDRNYLITGKPEKKIGIAQATTLKCFCRDHDRNIFKRIDDEPYHNGDREQEFLFAFRAAARELLTKIACVEATLPDDKIEHFSLAEYFNYGQMLGVYDQIKTQKILIDTLIKRKFNVIDSAVFVLDKTIPIVASSSFNLEVNERGDIINNVLSLDISDEMKPCFLTLFPQDDKMFCIISYLHKHRKDYAFLKEIANTQNNNKYKQIVVSNLLLNYIENFAVQPSFWNEKMKNKPLILARTIEQLHCQFVSDHELDLFEL